MSNPDPVRAVANLRKKRSVVKGAMTKLGHRVEELERNPTRPNGKQAATLLLERVQGLEQDFKSLHEEIVESIDIDDETELQKEQDILDHQDEVSEDLILRLRILLESNDGGESGAGTRSVEKMLRQLRSSLTEVKDALKDLDG